MNPNDKLLAEFRAGAAGSPGGDYSTSSAPADGPSAPPAASDSALANGPSATTPPASAGDGSVPATGMSPGDVVPSTDPTAADPGTADPNAPAHTAPDVAPPGDVQQHDDFSQTPQAQQDFANVPVPDIVAAADQYPVQSFAFAVENVPEAAPAVLGAVFEKSPAQAFALLMDFVHNTVADQTTTAVEPFAQHRAQQQAADNATRAHLKVSELVKDATSIAGEAAKVVQERFDKLQGHTEPEIEAFLTDCYDIARGRVAAAGGLGPVPRGGAQAPDSPGPVLGGNASHSPAGDVGAGAPDAWAGMETFRQALGV